MTPQNRKDIIAGVLFLILALIAVFVLIPRGVAVPQSVKVLALSPDFWPRIIAIGAVLASIFVLIEARTMKQPTLTEDDDDGGEFDHPFTVAAIRAGVLIVALFVFYYSLSTLGVVVASILLIIALMLFFEERRYVLIGALGVGVPVLLYLFFRYVAGVPMPLGIFG